MNNNLEEVSRLRARAQIATLDTSEAALTMEMLQGLAHTARDAFHNPLIRSAMVSSAIVSYCRPFKRSQGASAASRLRLEDLNFEGGDELLAMHHRIVALRDQLVAHSDADVIKVEQTEFVRSGPGQYSCKMETTAFEQVIGIPLQEFRRLIGSMNSACVVLAGRLSDQLYEAQKASSPGE